MRLCVIFLLSVLWMPRLAMADDQPLDLSLPNLDGELVSLVDYRGQWLVLNYWATWCRPCIKEFPELDALHDNHADVTVLGLNFENAEDERLRRFLEQNPVSYPILRVDVYEPPAQLGAPPGLPTTFLVDPDGLLRHTITGLVSEASLLEALQGLGR